ncbi:sensor domain-containing diguanylate cyclase [Massilia niastensis]|uniref:sensor domain-containing diguanylate cyclase n=1 Tax=Massilia niastensis TaxID=544911 RepID=UPI0009FECCC3|nr:diguanylate cyclase [Massilia niastensis]
MKVNSPTFSSRFIPLIRNWPVLVTAILGVLVTIASYLAFQWQEQQRIASQARFDASEYSRMLQEGAQSYVHLNRDVAGLFSVSIEVTPREFESYIKRIQALETHPGLSRIGYLPRVATSQIAQFETETRKTIPSYSVQGKHRVADAAFPLLYAAPLDKSVKRFLGFDYAAIPERWEAMRNAADLGKSVATQKLAYHAAPTPEDRVFIFTPVYDASRPIESPAQRQAALSGYVFSVFLMEDVIEGVMGSRFKQQFDLEIYDGALGREHLLYDGDRQAHALEETVSLGAYTETVDFAGRRWILYFQPKEFYTARYASPYSWLILLSGGLASIFLSWLTWKWLDQRRAQRQQAEHAQRFHAVFEHHPSAVFSLDTQWRIVNANSQAIQQFETSRSRLVGASVLKMVASEDVQRVAALLDEALSGASVRYDSTLITDNHKRIEVSIVLIPVTIAGKVCSVLGIADNITERRHSEWRLQESRQMLQLVIDNIPQRVFWKDTALYFLGGNKAFCADAGLDDPQQIIGKTDKDFAWKEEAEAYRQDDLHTIQSGIARINYEEAQHRQGEHPNWLRTSKIPLTDAQGQTVGVLGMYEDITERKRLEQRLEHMALYDSLSGLPNRANFLARLEQAVDKATWQDTLIGVMYFDIDKFKRINDTYGHDVGDEVIAMFAARVTGAIRENDVVGRLGGDEFCLLVELPNRQAAHKLAVKLIEAMRPLMQVGETALQVGTSIGIAFHEPGITADELIRRADQAMYLAKQAGGNQYDVAQDEVQPA